MMAYLSEKVLDTSKDDRSVIDGIDLNPGYHEGVLPRHALRQVIHIQLNIHGHYPLLESRAWDFSRVVSVGLWNVLIIRYA